MKIDFSFDCSRCDTYPGVKTIIAEVEGVDIDLLIEAIGTEEILERIGSAVCKDYFNLIDSE